MTDIVEFLLARLDEDEAAAKAWIETPWGETATHWRAVGRRQVRYDNGCMENLQAIDVSGRGSDLQEAILVRWDGDGTRSDHVARHDPARALAEVQVKRKILELHQLEVKQIESWPFDPLTGEPLPAEWDVTCQTCGWASDDPASGCETIRALTYIYVGHPDFNSTWRLP